jgi:hypothetical protein
MKDYRTAPIEPEMKHLLSFAEKMAREASQITPEDIETIRLAASPIERSWTRPMLQASLVT